MTARCCGGRASPGRARDPLLDPGLGSGRGGAGAGRAARVGRGPARSRRRPLRGLTLPFPCPNRTNGTPVRLRCCSAATSLLSGHLAAQRPPCRSAAPLPRRRSAATLPLTGHTGTSARRSSRTAAAGRRAPRSSDRSRQRADLPISPRLGTLATQDDALPPRRHVRRQRGDEPVCHSAAGTRGPGTAAVPVTPADLRPLGLAATGYARRPTSATSGTRPSRQRRGIPGSFGATPRHRSPEAVAATVATIAARQLHEEDPRSR